MAADIEPAELASLLDTAERPRAEGWSFRAALTRYGQPEPRRASAVIELLRRIEGALKPHLKRIEREGVEIWKAVEVGDTGDPVLELLAGLRELDRLGDVIAVWAVDRAGERPAGDVDEVVAGVTATMERLGIEREERPRPSGRRH